MRDLTAAQPKCMAVLAGKRLIDWQLEALKSAGITKIGIIRGYMSETLSFPGVTTFENPRWSETNMVMSLTQASLWLTEDSCLVSYSDIVYPSATVAKLAEADGDIVITYDVNWLKLWRERFGDPLSDAETFSVDAFGRLLEIGNRANDVREIHGQYMGLLRFSPKGWGLITDLLAKLPSPVRDKLDMTSLLRRLLEDGRKIMTIPTSDPWYEVDSESDLKLYQEKATANGGSLW